MTTTRDHGQAERDLRRILAIQGLRALGYGFGSVMLGAVLAAGGLSAAQVGAVFTTMLVGMALGSLVVGRAADRIGRRRTYVVLLLLMAVAAGVFAVTQWVPLLLLVALTGTLSTDPNESGPITTLEQAMIGSTPAPSRARLFGRCNAVAYLTGSIGALLAGGPASCARCGPVCPPTNAGCSASPFWRSPPRCSPAGSVRPSSCPPHTPPGV